MQNFRAFARLLLSAGTFYSVPALGHLFDSMELPPEGLHAHLAVSGAYRTKGLVKKSESWTVPGTLMGGEAFPFEAGLALDEVFLTPIYRQGESYAMLKVGKHAGAQELELDHALVGFHLSENVAFEGGKMAAIFTPFNGEHASDLGFSARRLGYDVLWGGQFNDEGVRVKARFLGLDLGAEAWRGQSFPAYQSGSSRPAFDFFGRYSLGDGSFKFQAGGFFFNSKPQSRDDDRSGGSHSHSTGAVTIDPTFFEGSERVSGAFGKLTWNSQESLRAGVQGEVSQANSKGHLRDATREASFENRTRAYWGEMFLGYGDETVSIRSERLKVNNTLRGNAAAALSQKLGFLASRKDPYRHTLSFQHTFGEHYRMRAEWIRDLTTLRKKDVFVVSGVWSGMVFHWAE
ncbi:MAG: hypothetical protein IOD12_18255 [Silvanigrellales bacterium]|nr:hypothetical protein [Silvanigrellales bacterium]